MKTKPNPPADLWEQLDLAMKETSTPNTQRSEKSFTAAEFARRFALSRAQTNRKISRLIAAGKVKTTRFPQQNADETWVSRQGYEWVE